MSVLCLLDLYFVYNGVYLYIYPMRFLYACILLAICLPAWAKNYYVNSETGKPGNNGKSISKPKNNIQDVVKLTQPGDTVFVMNGTYKPECSVCDVLVIDRGGKREKNKEKYVVYTNYPGHHPVIKFTGWSGISIRNGASFIKIIGFEVIGNNGNIKLEKALMQPQSCRNKRGKVDPRYNGNGIIISSDGKRHSHHIIIAKNIVHDCGGGGIGAIQADYITVEDNLVYNNSLYTIYGTSGISFYQFWNSNHIKGYHNFIRRNKCYYNRSLVPWIKNCRLADGNGIIVDDFRNKQYGSRLGNYEGRTLIENNVSWFNGGTGIHTFQSDHIDIINNTAFCNSRTPGINAGQILSGLSNDNKIINNILVSDSTVMINSNYTNTNLTYKNNMHYNISHPRRELISVTGEGCISGIYPKFISPVHSIRANFGLAEDSPARGKGNTKFYSKFDIEGRPRAQGKAPNMGAYEN